MDVDAQEAGGHIAYELLILTRHLEMTSPHRVRTGALDRSAFVLLNRLEAQGPMSIPDFVEAFGMAPSTFTRQTSTLLRDGLVERTLDPQGSVARKFRITEEGLTRLKAEQDFITKSLAGVVSTWPSDRLERFVSDLEQFNTDIERRTGRPWPR